MTGVCGHGGYCQRIPGHAGVHTARPTPLANGWDRNREEIAQAHIDAAVTLLALDFPSPWYADLLDEEAS
jgi:hypothetical protein